MNDAAQASKAHGCMCQQYGSQVGKEAKRYMHLTLAVDALEEVLAVKYAVELGLYGSLSEKPPRLT